MNTLSPLWNSLLKNCQDFLEQKSPGIFGFTEPLNQDLRESIAMMALSFRLKATFVVNDGTLGPEGCPVKEVMHLKEITTLPKGYTHTPSCVSCVSCTQARTYDGGPKYYCQKLYKGKTRPLCDDEISSDEFSCKIPDSRPFDIEAFEELSRKDSQRFSRRIKVASIFSARYAVEPFGLCPLYFKKETP
jgi:hypothetical protein